MTWRPAPSTQRTMTRWSRALAAALAALAAVLLWGLWVYGQANPSHRRSPVPEQVLLQPSDRPLLTDREKEWARESGIGAYTWDGMTVVDEGLPEGYWQPQWHE